mgnify:CR=1 FL=1
MEKYSFCADAVKVRHKKPDRIIFFINHVPNHKSYTNTESPGTLVKTTTGIKTNQRGLLTVNEDGSTTREGVFAGGDAVMGARTVVEAVAIAKKVAESMDSYMKSLPKDPAPDPYADIPVFSTPTSDVLTKQGV